MPVIGWLDNAAPTADHRQVPQPKIHGPRTQIARGAIRLLDQGLIALLRCLPQASPPRMVPGCVPGIGFGPARHAPSLSWLYGKSTPPPSHVRCWQAKPTPWSWVARRARPVGAGAREIYAGLRINIPGRTRTAPVDRQRRASLQKATRRPEMGTITRRGQSSGSLQRFRNSPIGSSGACGK